jgi:hypothetical protein
MYAIELLSCGLVVAALVGAGLRSLHRRCVLCQCKGEVRRYPLMTVTLCSPCLLSVELVTAVPGEIEREVSCAVDALRAS